MKGVDIRTLSNIDLRNTVIEHKTRVQANELDVEEYSAKPEKELERVKGDHKHSNMVFAASQQKQASMQAIRLCRKKFSVVE